MELKDDVINYRLTAEKIFGPVRPNRYRVVSQTGIHGPGGRHQVCGEQSPAVAVAWPVVESALPSEFWW